MIPPQASPAPGSAEMARLMTSLNVVTMSIVLRTTSRTTISLPPIEKDSWTSGSFRSFSSAKSWICLSASVPWVTSRGSSESSFAPG